MKINEIQDLIKLVSRSGVNAVSIEKPDFKIVIKSDGSKKRGKNQEPVNYIQQAPMPVPSVQQQVAMPTPVESTPAPAAAPEATQESKYVEVRSPMIGTFYRSPSPDKDPFIEVGDTIKEGDVLCVIEAMKLFNEIESEVRGKIVKILIDDSTPVEYDQPLFLVDPS